MGILQLHYGQLIHHWTKDLTIFTNGKSTLTPEQTAKIKKHNIQIIEKEINFLYHENGHVQHIAFKDQSTVSLKAIYSRPDLSNIAKFRKCWVVIPQDRVSLKLICSRKPMCQRCICMWRQYQSNEVSCRNAVATGTMAGVVVNNGMIEEDF